MVKKSHCQRNIIRIFAVILVVLIVESVTSVTVNAQTGSQQLPIQVYNNLSVTNQTGLLNSIREVFNIPATTIDDDQLNYALEQTDPQTGATYSQEVTAFILKYEEAQNLSPIFNTVSSDQYVVEPIYRPIGALITIYSLVVSGGFGSVGDLLDQLGAQTWFVNMVDIGQFIHDAPKWGNSINTLISTLNNLPEGNVNAALWEVTQDRLGVADYMKDIYTGPTLTTPQEAALSDWLTQEQDIWNDLQGGASAPINQELNALGSAIQTEAGNYVPPNTGSASPTGTSNATTPNISKFFINAKQYLVNGVSKIMADAEAFMQDGRALVPVKYLADALGISDDNIQWNSQSQTISLSNGQTTVQLIIGKPEIIINGVEKAIDAVPTIVNGRTYLPARYLAEAFGYQVGWDSNSQAVVISNLSGSSLSAEGTEAPEQMWKNNNLYPGAGWLSPLITQQGDNGDLYLANADTAFCSVNAVGSDGTIKWQYPQDSQDNPFYIVDIATVNNVIYIITSDSLIAISSDGQELWTNSNIGSPKKLAASNSQLYVLSEINMSWYVSSIKQDGTINWQDEVAGNLLDQQPFGLTTDNQGDVYGFGINGGLFQADTPYLYKITPSGDMIWQADITTISNPPDLYGTVITSNGYAYVICGNGGTIQVLSQSDGKMLATSPSINDYIENAVADPSGNLFVQTYNKVLEFNYQGQELNQIDLNISNFMGTVQPIMLLGANILYTGDGNVLTDVSPNGTTLWQLTLNVPSTNVAWPIFVDQNDTIYVDGADGLYAFR